MTHNPQTHRFFLMTVDPVHVGTGGTRLGRVDQSIVREPGTNLPKIPGSSLHGVIRTYAAHRYGKPQCAGQGQQEGRTHCGQPTCPICYTFGYARDREGGHAGVVAISDARILLFPVYSMVGPVWVTSPSALKAAGLGHHNVSSDKACWGESSSELPTDQPLNLGWLMVEWEGGLSSITWPSEIPDQIRKRVVLVSDKLFSQIVNSNLEVRTSVSINPETGAAEERALFTYEAIPRATVLWLDVVVSDYRGEFPSHDKVVSCWNDIKTEWEQKSLEGEEYPPEKEEAIQRALPKLREAGFRLPENIPSSDREKQNFWKLFRQALLALRTDATRYQETNLQWENPLDVLNAGLAWAEHLGVGGMGTRGFGRIRELVCCPVEDDGTLGGSCKKDEGNAHGGTENTEE